MKYLADCTACGSKQLSNCKCDCSSALDVGQVECTPPAEVTTAAQCASSHNVNHQPGPACTSRSVLRCHLLLLVLPRPKPLPAVATLAGVRLMVRFAFTLTAYRLLL
eukprot:GHUV01029940.1.p1 GENE.GHUV01029940.1~~GHUV01029940.1.p1  ORF type:complete len:107 (-),score=15.79 GHUV01029940.1:1952-2272(-)